MATCNRCELCKTANTIRIRGRGPIPADIMIIGEAPGYHEDLEGKPFIGKAGNLLTQYLKECGVSRSEVYITNVVKCRPPENRTPTKDEIKSCSVHLAREIERVQPKYIMLLGNTALQGVMGRSGIKKYRGSWMELEGIQVMATYHPAAALRNPSLGVQVKADFMRLTQIALEKVPVKKDIPYLFVKTKNDLKEYLEAAKKAINHAYDFENIPNTSTIICQGSYMEFEDGSMMGYFIPLYHPESPFRNQWEKVLDIIAPPIEKKKKCYKADVIAHNSSHEGKMYRAHGRDPHIDWDTLLGAHMLDENSPKNLEFLSQTMCNAPDYKREVDNMKLIDEKLWKVAKYNIQDAYYTLLIKKIQEEKIREDDRLWTLFTKFMMPAEEAFQKASYIGVPVDSEQLKKMTRKAEIKMYKAQTKMKKWLPKGYELRNCSNCRRLNNTKVKIQCPHPDKVSEMYICDKYMEPKDVPVFNFNSTKQLAWLLYDILGLEPPDDDSRSTAENVLIYLNHPILKHLKTYKEWQKLHSTYLIPWSEVKDSKGRIHPRFKLWGTVTHRLAMDEPNLQNVPRLQEVRTIISDPEGLIVEADYSQIELRTAAHIAGEQTMIRIYVNDGDIHTETACVITGKRPQDITKDERKKAKAVNFGFLYGMGSNKFIQYAKEKYDVEFTPREAKTIRDRFFKKYKYLKPWHEKQKRIVNKLGYVRSPLGNKRRLPDIYSMDEGVRAEAERQSINSPVQSVPPYLTMYAIAQLDKMPGFWEECPCILQVHDALLFNPKTIEMANKWAPIIKREMEEVPVKELFGFEFMVPIKVDISIGPAWGKGEEWTEEVK